MNLIRKTLFAFCPLALFAADELIVENGLSPREFYDGKKPVQFTLKLDAPADAAKLLYVSSKNFNYEINGEKALKLKPSPDRKTFTGEIPVVQRYWNPFVWRFWRYSDGRMQVIPVITRAGKEIRLPKKPIAQNIRFTRDLMLAGNALPGGGIFDTGLTTDGNNSMAYVQRMHFNPDKGSAEMWLFLPLQLNRKSGIVFFLQAEDGSPWSYHQLSIPANTRKLEYMVYRKEKSSRITMRENIMEEDFVHVKVCWDISANRMELFVNGKSAGTAPYTLPYGGRKSSISFGGRIHYSKNGLMLIGCGQMALDEFRITDNPVFGKVPDQPFDNDESTYLLLHFDEKNFSEDSCTRKRP